MIAIPFLPTTQITVSYVSNAKRQQGIAGGPTQVILSLGDRFKLNFAVRNLKPSDAQWLSSMLNQSISQPMTSYLPPMPDLAGVGSPSVAAAVTSMSTQLSVAGFPANYTNASIGLFFNITTSGTAYLYQTTTAIEANGSGVAEVGILPMLRVPHNAGDVCNFANPVIQGYNQTGEQKWTYNQSGAVSGISYTVLEGQ